MTRSVRNRQACQRARAALSEPQSRKHKNKAHASLAREASVHTALPKRQNACKQPAAVGCALPQITYDLSHGRNEFEESSFAPLS